ncbi:hypothetical protein TKWG_20415 [Advenella kashmirensis WT001]|uniref:Uncharacterized protein n=1 Tax=Advenella kashmirensis (strain DSM 17095 / LMG 22695 / WT001) TaxID=1036672 RepID=I3UFP5_ADVKW|nr:hypothetical protein TKWG_20415 [Advenella kashmirensis WT001]
MQEKVRKLGLQDRIHLPGKTDQPGRQSVAPMRL